MALILVVDDDPHIAATIAKLLQSHGYQVDRADNGALALLRAAYDTPDLIILDMAMPVLRGQETIEALRSDPRTANIPIIVLSGMSDDTTQGHALRAGADVFLPKPPAPRELLTVVARLLSLRHEDGNEA
jgi:CheY-like chemotaxis protein